MKRVTLGWLLILHAFAHASAGTWTFEQGPAVLVNTMWALAVVAYFSAALGCLRVPLLRDWWKSALIAATLLSICLLAWFAPPWWFAGVMVDLLLFLLALDAVGSRIDDDIAAIESRGIDGMPHPRLLRAEWVLGALTLAYISAVSFTRPVQLRWGSTAALRDKPLPGDEVLVSTASYRIDHAIVIHAPPESIWPWLVQLGQDRAGFYSYDWLERAVGDHVHNADWIDPAWQRRAVGDTIFATQPTYLGGRVGHPGWRVTALEPNRVIGLENWGTFVLDPIDSSTTRLIVRTRGAAPTTFRAFALAPLNVFVFEPAHFIMERSMLRGIRYRAEHITPARRMSAAGGG